MTQSKKKSPINQYKTTFFPLRSIITIEWIEHNVSFVQGIKGLASGVFFENLGNSFLEVSKIGIDNS